MPGELRVSMLFEANTAAARAAVKDLQAATGDMRGTLEEVGAAANRTTAPVDAVAAGFAAAGEASGNWQRFVTELRRALNPLADEAAGLTEAMRQVTFAEEAGALSAHEAALAQDALARKALELQARAAGMGLALDGSRLAAERQETALQKLIAANTGLAAATGRSVAAELQHGQMLDQLRARFDPLFAAQRRYELELGDIAEAERLGAISATTAAEARDRAARAMGPLAGGIGAVGQASRNSAAYVANLSFQLNDIGMMMAMGQSPFMLMMQQGPQVTQVLGQMRTAGIGLGAALRDAFAMMVNPTALATLAVIGFGAAAVKWFRSAGDSARDAAESVSQFSAAMQSYSAEVKLATQDTAEMVARFGEFAGQIREVAVLMADVRLGGAMSRLGEAIDDNLGGLREFPTILDAIAERQQQIAEMQAQIASAGWGEDTSLLSGMISDAETQMGYLQQRLERTADDLGLSVDQAKRLSDVFARIETARVANDLKGVAAASGEAAALIREFYGSGLKVPAVMQEVLSLLAQIQRETAEAARATEDLRSPWQGVLRAIQDAVAGAPGSGWLAGAIADAAQLATTLWSAAAAAAAANANGQPGAVTIKPGLDLNTRETMERWGGRGSGLSQPSIQEQINALFPGEKGRGRAGGGGAAAIDESRRALDDLIASEQQQIRLLQTTDPLQRAMIENHEALKTATEGERQAVEHLIAERQRLEQVAQATEEMRQSFEAAFRGIVTGSESVTDALSNILGKLADLAADAAFQMLWKGVLGDAVGSFFDWLIPGKAEGGRVSGPGGPREDNLLHWLSDGEFVVNAADTARNLPLLEAMNAGLPAMDLLKGIARAPRLADGGLVGAAPALRSLSGSGRSDPPGGAPQRIELRLHLDSELLRAEIVQTAAPVALQISERGIDRFSRHELPDRVARIGANPRLIG